DVVETGGVKALFLGETPGASIENFPQMALRRFQQLHAAKPFHLVHSLDASGFEVGLRRKELGVAVVYDVDATHMAQIYSILGMSQETLGSLVKTSLSVAYNFLRTYYKGDRKLLKTADAVFV